MKSTREEDKNKRVEGPRRKKTRTEPVQIAEGYDLLANLIAAFPQKKALIVALHKSMPRNRGGELHDYSIAEVVPTCL
jgi:hypothetical protein